MHPSLQLSELTKLPSFLEKLARKAANPVAATPDVLARFHGLVEASDQNQISPFLPTIYALLDVTEIDLILRRLGAEADTDIGFVRRKIFRGWLGLCGVSKFVSAPFSYDIFEHLWPRTWQWMHFLHSYLGHLPSIPDLASRIAPDEPYATFITILPPLRGGFDVTALAGSTPGLSAVIGAAWRRLVHNLDGELFTCMSRALARVVCDTDTDADRFYGLAAGTGGVESLSRVVLAHLRRTVPHPDTVVSDATCTRLLAVASLVMMTWHLEPAFRDTLLDGGLAETISVAAYAMTKSTMDRATRILAIVVPAAAMTMLDPRGHISSIKALRAGFLRAVLDPRLLETSMNSLHVVAFIDEIAQRYAVFLSVLPQLRRSLQEAQKPDPCIHFKDRDIVKKWNKLTELVERRFCLAEEHLAGAVTSHRACDNLECGIIQPHPTFKRCSRCFVAHYCSRLCQKMDWYEGGHRFTCHELRQRYLEDRTNITTKDWAFLRTLLHQDYHERRYSVTLKLLRFMRAHPSQTPYTQFDYRKGKCDVSVRSSVTIDTRFDIDVQRAARSGGRMHLHFMLLYVGHTTRLIAFPLRTSNAIVQRGLLVIVQGMPPVVTDWKPYEQRVKELLKLEVVQSH